LATRINSTHFISTSTDWLDLDDVIAVLRNRENQFTLS